MEVKRLRLLVELSRRGTIAAVAQAMSYSPSAVSQQLDVLEKEAGTPLLEPAGRRVRLTAEGEVLVGYARAVLAQLEEAQTAMARSRSEVEGIVRVAGFQSAVLALLLPVVDRLAERYPALRLEITELEPEASIPALAAGDFDLVLGEEYPGHPLPVVAGVLRADLLLDPLELVVPAGWEESTLPQVRDRPFTLEPVGTTSRTWAATACRLEGFEPDVRYTSTDLQIQLRIVERGLAAALLPGLAGARGSSAVHVQPLPGRPHRRVFTVTREGGRDHPRLAAVVDALASVSSDA